MQRREKVRLHDRQQGVEPAYMNQDRGDSHSRLTPQPYRSARVQWCERSVCDEVIPLSRLVRGRDDADEKVRPCLEQHGCH